MTYALWIVQGLLALIFLFAYVGIAWNLMMGFAGQLSLGHALYFGVPSRCHSGRNKTHA